MFGVHLGPDLRINTIRIEQVQLSAYQFSFTNLPTCDYGSKSQITTGSIGAGEGIPLVFKLWSRTESVTYLLPSS